MQTISVIKKLTAHGLKVIPVPETRRFYADTPTDRISWIDQGGSAICLKVTAHGDESDIQSDYHAGTYADSINQALKLAGLKFCKCGKQIKWTVPAQNGREGLCEGCALDYIFEPTPQMAAA